MSMNYVKLESPLSTLLSSAAFEQLQNVKLRWFDLEIEGQGRFGHSSTASCLLSTFFSNDCQKNRRV